MGFPENFVWGAAAASYQIEGAAREDGKGLSVWDVFVHTEGKVWRGDTGDIACDHYHRYEEDVALMKQIGLQAYRLSISWPRILPQGTGEVNPAGLDFYDRLIDTLLAAGITPYVTLFHWDLPYALDGQGSWLNPDMPDWFADYTRIVVGRLGDRVKHWMTINEPVMIIIMGHQNGEVAPGRYHPKRDIFRMIHHLQLSHGKAVQAIRATAPDARVGLAHMGNTTVPQTENDGDIDASRQHMFGGSGDWDASLWLDPILKGTYPQFVFDQHAHDLPDIGPNDMQTMMQPLDFLGVNIYQGEYVQRGPDGRPMVLPWKMGNPMTHFHWNIIPETMYWGPKFLYERYGLPILITENGLSNADWVSLDGKVHDPQRIDFTRRYLLQFRRAAEEGVPVHGYMHWSIMDNFEWAQGMKHRFGLIYVDYETQERILKDSASWYRDVIASNGATLDSF